MEESTVKIPVCYPWDGKTCRLSEIEKESVNEHLSRMKYPLKKTKNRPDGEVVFALETVMPLLLENKWLVVASSSSNFLQALALYCPVSYSLSTLRSCHNVTTDSLADIFSVPRPRDDFQDDPAGEVLYKIRGAGLLVWEDIQTGSDIVTRYEGRFADLLKAKRAQAKSVLFTLWFEEQNKGKLMKDLTASLRRLIGPTAAALVLQNSEFLDFKVKTGISAFRTVTPE